MPCKTKYDWILEQYPETIQKEQLYKICHISKRTATMLLKNGMIPCHNTRKKTRQYTIATQDVVTYLLERELDPEKFSLPIGSYASKKKPRSQNTIKARLLGERAEAFYSALLELQPDVLSVMEVRAATGYCVEGIRKWCRSGKVIHFVIDGNFMIPKVSLLAFMLSGEFRGVKYRSKERKRELLALLDTIK